MPHEAPGTITDEDELSAELETICTDGIAYACEESIKGLLEITSRYSTTDTPTAPSRSRIRSNPLMTTNNNRCSSTKLK